MKSILLSIKPEWLAKILNGEKTIEVRKKFPKDYVGWVYLYCSKRNELVYFGYGCGNVESLHTRKQKELMQEWKLGNWNDIQWFLDKKEKARVVARFWCDKVENINYVFERYCFGEWSEEYLQEKSCLTAEQLHNYLKAKTNDRNVGYAIHISKLEIFDRPRELGEFIKCDNNHIRIGNCFIGFGGIPRLTKAPQNYMFIEGE